MTISPTQTESTAEFLARLRQLGVRVWADEGKLRYKAPKGVMTADLLGSLKAHKEGILALLQQVEPTQKPSTLTLEKADRERPIPLSAAQRRLWFLEQLHGASAAYNIAGAFVLTGALNREALAQSLTEIVRRHESLRTIFGQEAVQVILPAEEIDLPLPCHDLRDLPEGERWAEARQIATAEAETPFDITADLLVRAQLLQTAAEQHILLITFHHLVTDGQSLAVFNGELVALYGRFAAGEPSPLAALTHQYADFAVSQQAWLDGEQLAGQVAYWQERLAGAPELLQLPLDYPRPAVQTFGGAVQAAELGANVVAKLKALAQGEGSSLYMVVQAALSAFLGRYSNQADVLTGLSAANRHHAGLEGLIGFFVNTLVMRVDLEAKPTFRQLVQQVRETALDGFTNQDVPFEKLVETLRPERDMSYAPLVQVMMSWLDGEQGMPQLPALTVEPFESRFVPARLDLVLEVYETAETLKLMWVYNTDLFAAETVERIATNFNVFVEALAENADRGVYELPLLSAAEQELVVAGFNETGRDYPQDVCLHELFEAQVEKTPDKIAVRFRDEALSYAELNGQANVLARRLREIGVGRNVFVGVCMERSLEMVVALYGVLKAGGAYVPIDPAYPAERVGFMIEDSEVGVILTQEGLGERLPDVNAEIINCEYLIVNCEWGGNLGVGVSSGDLAYMIYTSGSTGRPKGAMNAHAGIVNQMLWLQEQYQLTEEDRVVQKTPFSFDVSLIELFWPLTVGAELVMAEPEGHKDSRYLATLVEERQITVIHFVPSMLSLFLEGGHAAACGSLRMVLCSGEALPYELQERFFEQYAIALHNLYGPTEAAIHAAYWVCQADAVRRSVPIGWPVSNTQLYIVDELNQPVPIGVAGELLIGGVQVAEGYWGREELTGERFVSMSNEQLAISKAYRTGDLARWREGGVIEYLGRVDFQVKLRGFRIELGEIEAALLGQAGVREAVVVLRDDLPGGEQLVGYLVADGLVDGAAVKGAVGQLLPDYMVPAVVVQLAEMPLSPNGKIDRKRLPIPEVKAVADGQSGRGPIEDGLAEIWAAVLGRPSVSIDDNFFDLGGHSLLAMQVITRIEATFGVTMPVRLIFEASTTRRLAVRIGELMQGERLVLPVISPAPSAESYPLSYAQQRLWILSQIVGQEADYNIATALRVSGRLDVSALQVALNELVARHETLRTRFVLVDGRPMQEILGRLEIPLVVRDVAMGDVERIAADEGTRPFDLTAPPLMRLTVLRVRPDEAVMLLTMHHIITDGWSLTVFVRELAELYEAQAQAIDFALPELPIQYGDYATWQHQYLTDEALAPQIDYWREQLAGLPPLLNLPTDRPRPAVQTSNGRIHYFGFDAELTAALKRVSREYDVTLFMTLLAGFATLLSRYSNQDDIPIGSGIANRTRPEIEPLIGFFVNTLVMRVDVSENPSLAELLARVRPMTLDGYANQDVPFERLVEILQPERNTSHAPLFQVIFTLQNLPAAEASLSELEIAPYHVAESTAKYDLTVLMTEEGDRLTGTLEYNTNLFDEGTMERLVAHFKILLRGAAAEPERPLLALPLLTEGERVKLAAWNGTAAEYPREGTIVSLFEEAAERFGEQTAVVAGNARVSYADLHEQVQRIASGLIERGVEAGDRVALLLPRNEQMIAAMLGVLAVGGVYVPLDPEYPGERIGHMLSNSGAELAISNEQLAMSKNGVLGSGVTLVNYEVLLQSPIQNLKSKIDPDSGAYLLYTSGSTGRPKGVLVSHRNVVRLMRNERHPFEFGEGDVWVVAHSFCFDFSVWEMYGGLLYGGTVVVAERETVRDTAAFLDLLKRERVTVLNQTPAAFYNLVGHEGLSDEAVLGEHLRLVIFGGDRLDPTYLREWVGRYPLDVVRLVNMYGITETTVHVTHYTLTEQDVFGEGGRSPIGVPIPETQVYILNEAGEMQPIGVPGEIYVGGTGVSLGYWDNPELTADRFVSGVRCQVSGETSPTTNHYPPTTLYKSGDLGRWLPDGTLEHMGRNDFQVQLRGFRIELGEIENVLLADEGVEKAVVIARGEDEEKRLLAYVIPAEGVLRRYAGMKQAGELEGVKLTELPDGQVFAHLNQSETAFIFEEIYTHNSYLQHGVSVKDGDVVVDVGANIGMFSLFAAQQAEGVKLIAFEPLPAAADCLRTNGKLYDLNLTVYQQGISDEAGEVSFNYYPHASVLSGQFAGTEDERETVRRFLVGSDEYRVESKEGDDRWGSSGELGNSDELLEELLDERLQVEVITAELVTLSQVIAVEGLERIDLLKIDVEKGERAVLQGVLDSDWGKIGQVVMEVHDVDGALGWVVGLLKSKGFVVNTDQDETLTHTSLYNVYAVREQNPNPKSKIQNPKSISPAKFVDGLREAVQEKLPEYMMPSGFVLLEGLPLTGNGKVDRGALPEPEVRGAQVEIVLPRNGVEAQLAQIWREVLNVAEVGVFDDFFALGGHSLLATQLVARIPAVFGVQLPLSAVFETPTVAALGEQIETLQWAAGLPTTGTTNESDSLEQGRL